MPRISLSNRYSLKRGKLSKSSLNYLNKFNKIIDNIDNSVAEKDCSTLLNRV